ncbi:MAG: DUF2148 domain-containing protein [Eubacteriales bacterium]
MMITSKQAELDAVMDTAKAMCVAIRTAPKTQGKDYLDSCIVTGEDIEALAVEMDVMGKASGMAFLCRDAGNLRNTAAVVLVAARNEVRGINEICQYCGFENCVACATAGGACAFTGMDLGIALGSAVSIAADRRVDNRIMFSAGTAAKKLGMFAPEYTQIIAIPLCARGKSPYFDRK